MPNHKQEHRTIPIEETSFASGGLKQTGNIRPNRLFTADTYIILYRTGIIKKEKLDRVVNKVVEIIEA
jgi:mRNA interferase MazF